MAAPKGKEEINKLFDEIINDISENGKSVTASLKNRMSSQTFFALLDDEERSKRYARACELRADLMADDIIDIADNTGDDIITLQDGREVANHEVINRDRLRVDSRKWLLSKLQPKKYGDKIDVAHSGGITLNFDSDDSRA
jgi:hypothetical protein